MYKEYMEIMPNRNIDTNIMKRDGFDTDILFRSTIDTKAKFIPTFNVFIDNANSILEYYCKEDPEVSYILSKKHSFFIYKDFVLVSYNKNNTKHTTICLNPFTNDKYPRCFIMLINVIADKYANDLYSLNLNGFVTNNIQYYDTNNGMIKYVCIPLFVKK